MATFSSLWIMASSRFALILSSLSTHHLLATFPLSVLAFLTCILVLKRRLPWRGSTHSCEAQTVSEPSHNSRKDHNHTPLPSNPERGNIEHLKPPSAPSDSKDNGLMAARRTKQSYDAFLVLDVEGTCVQGAGFDYPNEIIEWPVCLLRWKDVRGKRTLEVVDEFRSFVRPTWRPKLSDFCLTLTGITQEQVDQAPTFPEVLLHFRSFLEKHKLLDENGDRLTRFCFCTDGPFDIRDFVVKQCFISNISVPVWLTWDVMDVRRAVGQWLDFVTDRAADVRPVGAFPLPRRVSLSIPRQLHALGLEPFEGRQHSGIDDTRNISRLVVELARKGWRLESNTFINPNRRWPWMGKRGKVLEEYYS